MMGKLSSRNLRLKSRFLLCRQQSFVLEPKICSQVPKYGFLAVLFFLLISFSLSAATLPRRIVSGTPAVTEILFALGLEERVVGVTTNCNYPPAVRHKERIGGFSLNLERIAALKPDLVVLQEELQGREISRLKKFGLPVQTVKAGTIADLLVSIVDLGKVTGQERQANLLVSRLNAQLKGQPVSFNQIVERRPKVLVLVGYQPLVVGGGGSFIDEIIRYAGAENIAGRSRTAYPHYSFEELLRIDPEYLVIPRGLVPLSELQSDGRWKKLAAVRYDKVLFIDPDVISRPGPRVGEAVERISRFVYR